MDSVRSFKLSQKWRGNEIIEIQTILRFQYGNGNYLEAKSLKNEEQYANSI